MSAVLFDNVSIIFGPNPQRALDMADVGRTRDEISAETFETVGRVYQFVCDKVMAAA